MKIIAEIGSNTKCSADDYNSIDTAKALGANVVKFQYFYHQDLYGVPGNLAVLPNYRELSPYAETKGIEFMCTAFSERGYRMINPYVRRHKIASSEITALNLIEEVAGFKKPVLLSAGGVYFDVVDVALDILQGCEVTLLYCVADYPARIVDFRHLEAMKERYGSRVNYGYSDHSNDVLNIPLLARSAGAVVLEKHVNFTTHTDTPDAAHALSRKEFALMMKHLNGETSIEDTFVPNPCKRKLITLPEGTKGYFRPRADVR